MFLLHPYLLRVQNFLGLQEGNGAYMALHQGKIWVTSDNEGLLQNCASNFVSTASSKLKRSNNLCIKYMKVFHSSKGKTKFIEQSAALDSLSGGLILHGNLSLEDRDNTSSPTVI